MTKEEIEFYTALLLVLILFVGLPMFFIWWWHRCKRKFQK